MLALLAELVDAPDLGSGAREGVRVRVPWGVRSSDIRDWFRFG